ncbi:MAG: glutathione S-transferase [Phyllobacteriaceae bacterium]|nr:glutathione S-transferase [Phyllobacteriaceae bacterium]
MKIYGDVISPFVRMCLVTAHEAGLKDRTEFVKTAVKPNEVNADLQKLSPIAKIPVLETDHHHAIHDSRVIMEYLAHVSGKSNLIPDDGVKRFGVLTLLATAQGAADAAVGLRYEQFARPEDKRWAELQERLKTRVLASLDDVESRWSAGLGDINVGTIGMACMLGYVDFRHAYLNWRDGRPALAAFEKTFAARDSMQAWPLV